MLESPHHSSAGPPGFYNLTFTYRFDSDIIADNYLQYFRPSLWKSEKEFDKLWQQKTNLAAMFVSNCQTPSNRQIYVKVLQQDFPIDLYGDCGDKECLKGEKKCDELIQSYKFYLAFENRYDGRTKIPMYILN